MLAQYNSRRKLSTIHSIDIDCQDDRSSSIRQSTSGSSISFTDDEDTDPLPVNLPSLIMNCLRVQSTSFLFCFVSVFVFCVVLFFLRQKHGPGRMPGSEDTLFTTP